MNRTIQIVTEKLTELLPENQQHYKLEDLRSWGFPNFIVKRIQVELERNLTESMRLPQTDWANMQSSEVQEVWRQFIAAIRNQAWLPASYGRTVIETAVADVLEMLVEPRKNIPQNIFGADEKLSAEQLKERLKVLVVYRHFAHLLMRYMEKKEIEVLTKEKCVQIIKKADEKVISRYTPLNWAQMLEPLFKLMNEQIESNLLRLFFEDKKMARVARKFDFMEKPVNRAVLIETLSSPDSLNMEGFEEDQSDLFGAGESKNDTGAVEKESQSNKEQPADENEDEHEMKAPSGQGENEPEETPDLRQEETGETSEAVEEEVPTPPIDKSGENEAEFEHEEPSLNTIFAAEDNGEEVEEDDKPFFAAEEESEEQEDYTIDWDGNKNEDDYEDVGEEDDIDADSYSEEGEIAAKNEEEASPKEEAIEDDFEEDRESETSDEDTLGQDVEIKAEEKQETPMWQRFMSSEELDQLADEDENVDEEMEEENSYDDGFIEEPVFDISMEKEPTEEEIAEISETLEDERDYFIQYIFSGSERAYDEAIESIASKKGWRDASRFIEKEVFQRNMIDMYSEEAIEFTDRLHNYFIEKSNS